MNNTTRSKLLLKLHRHREALEDGEFPIYDSLIGYSLFLLLCDYEVRGLTPRLKDVYVELERSQGGVRRLVRAMARDGWITLARSDGDQRSRYLVPTPMLKKAIAKFVETIHVGAG